MPVIAEARRVVAEVRSAWRDLGRLNPRDYYYSLFPMESQFKNAFLVPENSPSRSSFVAGTYRVSPSQDEGQYEFTLSLRDKRKLWQFWREHKDNMVGFLVWTDGKKVHHYSSTREIAFEEEPLKQTLSFRFQSPTPSVSDLIMATLSIATSSEGEGSFQVDSRANFKLTV